jgi:hypothetical protein
VPRRALAKRAAQREQVAEVAKLYDLAAERAHHQKRERAESPPMTCEQADEVLRRYALEERAYGNMGDQVAKAFDTLFPDWGRDEAS